MSRDCGWRVFWRGGEMTEELCEGRGYKTGEDGH